MLDTKRISEKYGVEDEQSILKIAEAERELAQCQGCKGRCTKYPTFVQPGISIFGGQVYITAEVCSFGEKVFGQIRFGHRCRAAGIPSIYLGKTFANFQITENNKAAVEFAKKCLKENYRGAFFYGKVGVGKTFLAAIIAQEFLRADKTVKFGKVPDLLSGFFEIYRGTSKESEKALLNELYTVDLLVLDDFGLEKATQYTGSTLCKILDARYNRENSTTLITSNHSLKEIAEKFNKATDGANLNGTRIYDRCIEICKTIPFKGTSRRR